MHTGHLIAVFLGIAAIGLPQGSAPQTQPARHFEATSVKNPTRFVNVLDLSSCSGAVCMTFENAASRPLGAVIFTGRAGAYEWLNFMESTEKPGGLMPGDRYNVRMTTGTSVKSADDVRVLAAVLDDGKWQGNSDYAKFVFAYWAGGVVQDRKASTILARLGGGVPSPALIESVSSEISSLTERPSDAISDPDADIGGLSLSSLTSSDLARSGFQAGMHDAKESAARFVAHLTPDVEAANAVASMMNRYSAKITTARGTLRGYSERSAQ